MLNKYAIKETINKIRGVNEIRRRSTKIRMGKL